MVWDGNCGFCKYWIIRWTRLSKGQIKFIPFQEAAPQFPEIEVEHFKSAVRLIDVDGRVYSGPEAAYKSLQMSGKFTYLYDWYANSSVFRKLSDVGYQIIADNRNTAMKITKWLFGDNPINLKNYWVFYLMIIFGVLLLLL